MDAARGAGRVRTVRVRASEKICVSTLSELSSGGLVWWEVVVAQIVTVKRDRK